MLVRSCIVIIALLVSTPLLAKGVYFTLDELSQEVFSTPPSAKALWLTKLRKEEAKELMDYSLNQARVRYQEFNNKRLWVMSEIGKEKPITFGIVTQAGKIIRIEVMTFREVRGDEIRLPQYTAQYDGQTLTKDGKLTNNVDGISGATYSVRSMKKVARLALLFDQWANEG